LAPLKGISVYATNSFRSGRWWGRGRAGRGGIRSGRGRGGGSGIGSE